MQNYKNLSSVIRQVVTEAYNTNSQNPPFTPDQKSSFKKPAGSGPAAGMNRARELRDLALKTMQQKLKESFDLDITDEEADDLLEHILELDELSIKVYSNYSRDAKKSAKYHLKKSVDYQKKAFDQYDQGGEEADRSPETLEKAIEHARKSDKRTAGANLAAKKLARKFSKGMTEEEAVDLLNSIQESRWVDEYNFTPADHQRTAAGHLEDAKKHKSAGRNLEYHASMRGHHDSMERSYAVAAKPLFRGTGPA